MDIVAESANNRDPQDIDSDALYRHKKRAEWGVAVFLWERDGKRAFRFTDGETRVFKQGFYELMIPAPTPTDGSAEELRAKVRQGSGKKAAIVPTVGDQLVLLLKDYPKGFTGPTWASTHRGGGRRLKRHRDPSVAQARERFGAPELRESHEAGNYEPALAALIEVLAGTDLVPSAHVKKLQEANATQLLSATLIRFADDPERATIRELQAALVDAQGPATSWQVLTAPLALLAPHKHMCVHPSVFAVQGGIVMPRFTAPKRADEAGYQRYLEVARMVEDELVALGHAPTDLLDLHDFVWMTLRPAAREELERIHLQAEKSGGIASALAEMADEMAKQDA
jgi:hypothetical protein